MTLILRGLILALIALNCFEVGDFVIRSRLCMLLIKLFSNFHAFGNLTAYVSPEAFKLLLLSVNVLLVYLLETNMSMVGVLLHQAH